MGVLSYSGANFEFDDRLLAHLQIVMSTKLRRGESFFLGWDVSLERGSGRHAIWVDAASPIHISYKGSKQPPINRAWVEAMMLSAAGASGLRITDEPAPPA